MGFEDFEYETGAFVMEGSGVGKKSFLAKAAEARKKAAAVKGTPLEKELLASASFDERQASYLEG